MLVLQFYHQQYNTDKFAHNHHTLTNQLFNKNQGRTITTIYLTHWFRFICLNLNIINVVPFVSRTPEFPYNPIDCLHLVIVESHDGSVKSFVVLVEIIWCYVCALKKCTVCLPFTTKFTHIYSIKMAHYSENRNMNWGMALSFQLYWIRGWWERQNEICR